MQNDSTGNECVRLGVNNYSSINSQGQHVAASNVGNHDQSKAGNCRAISSSFGRPFTYLPNPSSINSPHAADEVKPPQVPVRTNFETKPKDPGAVYNNAPPASGLKTFGPGPPVQPIAPKSRPPLPPKRNECTRLTTVAPSPPTNLKPALFGSETDKNLIPDNVSKSQNEPSLLESSINSRIKTLKHVDPPVTKNIFDFYEPTEIEISNNINDGFESNKKDKTKNVVFENQLSEKDSSEPDKVENKILNDSSPPKALQRTVFHVVGKGNESGEDNENENKQPFNSKKELIIKDPEPKKKEPVESVKKDYGTLDSIIRQNAQQIKQSCSINKNLTNTNSNNVSAANNFYLKTSNSDNILPFNHKNETYFNKENNDSTQNSTKSNSNLLKTSSLEEKSSTKSGNDSKSDFFDVKQILSKVERVVKNKNGDRGKTEAKTSGEESAKENEEDSDPDVEAATENERDATADIWVRTINSPVRKSVKDLASAIESLESKTSDEKQDTGKKKQKNKKSSDSTDEIYPNENSVDNADSNYNSDVRPNFGVTQSASSNQLSIPTFTPPPPLTKGLNQRLVGSESLPCSRPGSQAASRSSSPAFFVNDKLKDKKISAAEALGVVAKPCPRIIPSSNTAFAKAKVEFRRQSLGNLSDSKFSVGGRLSSSPAWSSQVPSSASTDVESAYSSETFDYRRKRLSKRCSSVDSRTLSRCYLNDRHSASAKFDQRPHYGAEKGDFHQGFYTLSKLGSLRNGGNQADCKYFPKSTVDVVPSGYYSLDAPVQTLSVPMPDQHRRSSSHGSRSPKSETGPRPRSTCNCGHHLASLTVPVGKRTYSVEELPSSSVRHCIVDFNRTSNGPCRSSFGKSQQRVKFALDETDSENMGSYNSKFNSMLSSGSETQIGTGTGMGIMKKPARKIPQYPPADLTNHSDSNGILDLPPPPPPPPYQSAALQCSKGALPCSSLLKQPLKNRVM